MHRKKNIDELSEKLNKDEKFITDTCNKLIGENVYTEYEVNKLKKDPNRIAYVCTRFDIAQQIEKLKRQLTQPHTANEHLKYKTINTEPNPRQDKNPKHYIKKKKLNISTNINSAKQNKGPMDQLILTKEEKKKDSRPEMEKGKQLNNNKRPATSKFTEGSEKKEPPKEANNTSIVKPNPKNTMKMPEIKINLDTKQKPNLDLNTENIDNSKGTLKHTTNKPKNNNISINYNTEKISLLLNNQNSKKSTLTQVNQNINTREQTKGSNKEKKTMIKVIKLEVPETKEPKNDKKGSNTNLTDSNSKIKNVNEI